MSRVDVHKGAGGPAHVDRGRVENLIFCGRHKWMAPKHTDAISKVPPIYIYIQNCRNPLPIKSGSVARDSCCNSIPTPNTGSDMPALYWPITGPTASPVAYNSITCWRFVGSPQQGDTHSFPPLQGDGPQWARRCRLSGYFFSSTRIEEA